MKSFFIVYCGAKIDIGTNMSIPMEMIGIAAKSGTIPKDLGKRLIQS